MTNDKITGTTRLACLLGHPARHSLSPAIHNAVFSSANIDAVYLAFEVVENDLPHVVRGLRAMSFLGASVTMPHKEAVISLCDSITERAQILGSVNTLIPGADGSLAGDCTDGMGCVGALQAHGIRIREQRVVVVGAGATARACINALAMAGAASVGVLNRTESRATSAAAVAGNIGCVVGESDLASADIIVHATPQGMNKQGMNKQGMDKQGMNKQGEVPFDIRVIHENHVVLDAVYQPLETSLLTYARAAGATAIDGLDMLIHQGIEQQFLWTGNRPVPGPMRVAAERELAKRSANK
jgi:shikimate dehydrogenase